MITGRAMWLCWPTSGVATAGTMPMLLQLCSSSARGDAATGCASPVTGGGVGWGGGGALVASGS